VGFRRTLVSTGLRAIRSAGIFNVIANSNIRRRRLLILCYHGLSLEDEHEWLPNLYITPQQFRSRLESLRDMGAHVLPLGQALTRLRAHTLPPKSVVLTFDDGFYDFYRHAFPVLQEYGYPVTLYLTTHYCSYPLPVITLALDYLLWKSQLQKVELAEWGVSNVLPIQTYEERQQVVRAVLAWMASKKLCTEEKSDVAQEIARRIGVDFGRMLERRMLQIVNKEEAQQMAQAGVDLQLHTHRHRTPKNRDLFRREIIDNANRITELSGRRPSHFCYPSGHYVPEFLPWLTELDIKSATTCEKGLAGPESDDLTLPRILDDTTVSTVRFESLVAGLFA
jgi:peptidoglycan/xylan/chitin deacetylase (PgdA/CDA1 family)